MAQAMVERAPLTMPLQDLLSELNIHLKVSEVECQALAVTLSSIHPALGGEGATVGDLIENVNAIQMREACYDAGMNKFSEQGLAMLLGKVGEPFIFSPPKHNKEPPRDEAANGKDEVQLEKKGKGGILKEKMEMLIARRPYMTSYFPPHQFDTHRIGHPHRCQSELRKLIVQEVSGAMQ